MVMGIGGVLVMIVVGVAVLFMVWWGSMILLFPFVGGWRIADKGSRHPLMRTGGGTVVWDEGDGDSVCGCMVCGGVSSDV